MTFDWHYIAFFALCVLGALGIYAQLQAQPMRRRVRLNLAARKDGIFFKGKHMTVNLGLSKTVDFIIAPTDDSGHAAPVTGISFSADTGALTANPDGSVTFKAAAVGNAVVSVTAVAANGTVLKDSATVTVFDDTVVIATKLNLQVKA